MKRWALEGGIGRLWVAIGVLIIVAKIARIHDWGWRITIAPLAAFVLAILIVILMGFAVVDDDERR